MYGSRLIKNLFVQDRVTDPTALEALKRVYNDLGTKPDWELVGITHWEQGAWAKNYNGRDLGSTISKSDIIAEYRKRVHRHNERQTAAN